jgi:hypothetical protein
VNFQRLLGFVGRNAGDVAKSVVPGSALAAGFGLLEGPTAAATYGLMDLAAAFPATMAARGLTRNVKNPLVRGTVENVANIGASLGSTVAASNLLYGNRPVPTDMSQSQQIMQEMGQRAAINKLDVQAVAPGTQFQTAGIEFLNDYVDKELPNIANYLSPEELALFSQPGVA